MKRSEIEKALRKELDKERFRHTMGVMYTAASLAMAHGENMEKALLAGLLHDCAKCIPNDKKLKMCKKYQIDVTESEKKSPFLLHAKLGAYLAEAVYGVSDPDVLHAIAVHTTGTPGMNRLDKIIFIADYMEPNRDKAADLPEVRTLAFQDLDATMRLILKDTLVYLEQSRDVIDPMTEQTYKFFDQEGFQ